MKSLPLLLGAGAAIFLLSKSQKKTGKTSSGGSGGNGGGGSDNGPKSLTKRQCENNPDRYWKDGECHIFWDRKSPEIVRAELIRQMNGDQSACLSVDNMGDPNKDNPKMLELIDNVVHSLWKIPKTKLPPYHDEAWVEEVWNRTQKIFFKDICKLYSPYG